MPDPISSDSFGQGRRAVYDGPRPGPPPRPRTGRFLLVGLPLIAVFAAFGAIMWLAYVDATPGSASSQPPLIRADAAPIKVSPDDPGGRAVADQGELRGLIGDEELAAEPERLLPLPEEPIRPPAAESEATPADAAPTPSDGPQELAEATSGESTDGRGQAGRSTEAEAAAALDALLADVRQPDQQSAADPSGTAQTAAASTGDSPSAPAEASQPAPPVPPAAALAREALAALDADGTAGADAGQDRTPAPTPLVNAPAASDLRVVPAPEPTQTVAVDATYRIQLAAVRNESDARRAWTLFQDDLGDVLGGLDPIIERADTANGTFYRVQVGPFANLAAAESLCEELKQRNASCFVIRR